MIRVAITGVGIISPFGRGHGATVDALRNARSGVRLITSIDTSSLTCRIGGEVPAEDVPAHRTHDRFSRFALAASEEAAEQAGDLGLPSERVGVLLGTGLGGSETVDQSYKRLYAEGQRLPPTSIPSSMYNAAAAAVSARHNARGISYAIVSACASSAHAIGLAAQAIRVGQADAMITGGSDAPLVYGIIRGWEALRVLAVDNEHPERACRPFSADRKGLVLAEGAAVFILESMELAERRGAQILGEVAGFGATSDAGHITDPDPSGAARAMALALADARMNASELGYINAHGTGTRANDVTETEAIKEVFGESAQRIPISSTKSMHGHAMGASGAIEIASSLLALREGFIPPTINLDLPDPLCDLDYVPNEARESRARSLLSNSFGFGGMNASVLLRIS